MCRGVSGDACVSCNRRARARMSCIATLECLAAMRCTQCTVGELSLNRATCDPLSCGQVSSMMSHSRRSPAISKSEFVIVPDGLAFDMIAAVISSGHCNLNTVGHIALCSPIMMPPTPCEDASLTPM